MVYVVKSGNNKKVAILSLLSSVPFDKLVWQPFSPYN